jgi:hypothetical protein
MQSRIASIPAYRPWEGRHSMRIATIVSLIFVAGALAGCGGSGSGNSVEFVASNTDSVILDFAAKPAGELVAANDTAAQQCQLFHQKTAVLESLNVRTEGTIRATYLCKGSVQSADASSALKHRQ